MPPLANPARAVLREARRKAFAYQRYRELAEICAEARSVRDDAGHRRDHLDALAEHRARRSRPARSGTHLIDPNRHRSTGAKSWQNSLDVQEVPMATFTLIYDNYHDLTSLAGDQP
jgi:hypothetical protein